MRGGKSWLGIELKSFEISVEVIGRKVKRVIVERSKGFVSRIRFGSKSLGGLLEGLEVWCTFEL